MKVRLYSCFLSLVLSASCSGSESGFNDKSTLDENTYQLSWMMSVPDDTSLSAVSIPGTHDSLTLYGGHLIQCQAWTLEDQLKAGLRYFDARVGRWIFSQKTVDVMDGNIIHQRGKFRDVLNTIKVFLRDHGSETVLLRVTLEGMDHKKTAKLVKKMIEGSKDKLWTKTLVPHMHEARGKIVLVQSINFNVGILNHNTFSPEDDKFKSLENKMKKIRKHLEEAADTCSNALVLTDSTATALIRLKGPKAVARKVNDKLNNFIKEQKKGSGKPDCLGVISMDFPSPDLIKSIIETKPCLCDHGAETEPEPTAKPEPTAEPETKPTAKPEPTAEPEPKPTAKPEPTAEPEPKPTARPEPTAEPEPKPTEKLEPTAEPEPKPTAKPEPTAEPEPKPTAKPEPTAEPEPKPTAKPEPRAEPEPKPTAKPEPTAEPEPKPTAKPEPTAEPEPKPTAKPEPTAEPEQKPTAKPEPTAEPEPKPTANPEPTAEPEPKSTANPEPTAEPEPKPTTKPKKKNCHKIKKKKPE